MMKKPKKLPKKYQGEFRTSSGAVFGTRCTVDHENDQSVQIVLTEDCGVFNKGYKLTIPKYELRDKHWDGFREFDKNRKANLPDGPNEPKTLGSNIEVHWNTLDQTITVTADGRVRINWTYKEVKIFKDGEEI